MRLIYYVRPTNFVEERYRNKKRDSLCLLLSRDASFSQDYQVCYLAETPALARPSKFVQERYRNTKHVTHCVCYLAETPALARTTKFVQERYRNTKDMTLKLYTYLSQAYKVCQEKVSWHESCDSLCLRFRRDANLSQTYKAGPGKVSQHEGHPGIPTSDHNQDSFRIAVPIIEVHRKRCQTVGGLPSGGDTALLPSQFGSVQ